MEPTYTIKTASNMTDLNAHTIRAWERRYKALEPGRHDNGRRLYSNEDVSRLKLLAKLVHGGHSISSVAPLSTQMLSTIAGQNPTPAADSNGNMPAAISAPNPSVGSVVLDQCLNALKTYDLVHINSEFEAARLLFSAKDFVNLLAVPLIRRVGEMVLNGSFSIAQEHALSAVLRSQMMQILFNVRNSLAVRSFTRKDLPQGDIFAVATQEGDLHEFGALAASIIVAANGHIPHYFGANMPVKPLADAANAIHSKVVIVGVTYIPDEMRIMSDQEFAMELEMTLAAGTEIWWGGHANISDDFFAAHPRQRRLGSLLELDSLLSTSRRIGFR